jgi:hypothetical protein
MLYLQSICTEKYKWEELYNLLKHLELLHLELKSLNYITLYKLNQEISLFKLKYKEVITFLGSFNISAIHVSFMLPL